MSDQPAPPTGAELVRRHLEHVRRQQQRWADGYASRMSEQQPEVDTGRRTVDGSPVMKRDQHASLAHLAEERCPKAETVKVFGPSGLPGDFRLEQANVPGHERHCWMEGFLYADALVVKHGRTKVSADPSKVKREKRAPIAESQEMFPEAVLTPAEVRAQKAAAAQPHRSDPGEQR